MKQTKLAGVAAALFAVPFAPLWADAPKSPPSSPPAPTSQTSAAAPEPGEIRVVYPASATSTEPILFEPRDVVPPRSESRDAPFGSDVETPIGQVRAVLATLDELRRTQAALDAKLDALAAAPAPSLDPAALAAPLETLATRLDTQIAALETSVQTAFAQTLETALSDALPSTLATALQTLDGKLDAILEAPTEIDGWTLDAVGPNFVWTPDATTRPLFGDSGTFAVQVCVKRKSGGNPIYFTFRAVVK